LYSVSLPEEAVHVEKLKRLREKVDIDFWNEPEVNAEANFRVPPSYQNHVESFLNKSSLKFSVVTNDLQKWIDRERAENQQESDYLSGRQDATSIAFDHYHTYQEIYSFLEALQQKYPSVLQLVTIGKTYENHDIRLAKIGLPFQANNSSNSSLTRKPAFWLDAGIHAREWIAPATAVWIINELVTKQESDDEIRALVRKFDWYILPIANPDGYQV
jgi:murein tripeptide amidase MpaA